MTCTRGKQAEKCVLCAAISFPKWVDGIQGCENMSRLPRKIWCTQSRQILAFPKVAEKLLHLADNVLGIAERAFALVDAHGPEPARPAIDVLEQMAMDGSKMPNAQIAARKCLERSLPDKHTLELIQLASATYARNIL
jgi:hypothetical protein